MNQSSCAINGCNPPHIHITDAAMRLLQADSPHHRQSDEQLANCQDTILINEALSAAHNAPDLRAGKVAALKSKLASGEYHIDCLSIARGIIGENPELFK